MGGDMGVEFGGREAVRSFCTAVDACVNDCAGDHQADAHFSFARGVVPVGSALDGSMLCLAFDGLGDSTLGSALDGIKGSTPVD